MGGVFWEVFGCEVGRKPVTDADKYSGLLTRLGSAGGYYLGKNTPLKAVQVCMKPHKTLLPLEKGTF
jgi:hypothetical protein